MSNTFFVDCGANVGKVTLETFRDHPDWTFHAFEPNPKCIKVLHSLPIPNLVIHETAVWVSDGNQTLYLPKQILSGTLMTGKKNLPIIETLEVPTIDLGAWLLSLPPDPVVLKMDIEGAEYQVLPHLLDNGALRQVIELQVEFHYDRMTDVPKHVHDALMKRLTDHFGSYPVQVGQSFCAKFIWKN